jgi:hypothetical protein
MGFRPRARAALRLVSEEVRRLRARPAHRSTPHTLLALAAHHLHFDLDPRQPAPLLLPAEIGLRVGAALAKLFPSSRERSIEQAFDIAMRRCGLSSLRGFRRSERTAWTSLAPLWAVLPLGSLTSDERADIVRLSRAKGGPSERRYARLLVQQRGLETLLASFV